tara:strand:+ start:396 stop:680 length:285 start_codon:yes stop_codon:yes gene_type:complete
MTFKHERFDRHDVFEMKDTSLVLDIIQEVRSSDRDNDNIINMLFGLFDGYWYIGLESALRYHNIVSEPNMDRLSKLLKRVDSYIKINGQTYTMV